MINLDNIVLGIATIANAEMARLDVTTLRVCSPGAHPIKNSTELKPLVLLGYTNELLFI